MLAQHFAQRCIQQVSGRVVGGASGAFVRVYTCHERSFQMFGKLLGNMDRKIVFLLCVNDFDCFEFVHQYTGITYLTAAFGIERGFVQYNLVQCLVFLLYLSVTQNGCFVFRIVVAYEFGCTFLQCNPVSGFHGCCITCALLLLLHLGVKFFDVGCHTVFAENKLRKVERETECIIKRKGVFTADFSLTGCFGIRHGLIQQTYAGFQSTKERIFFFFDNFGYQFFLCVQFRICTTHIFNQYRQ